MPALCDFRNSLSCQAAVITGSAELVGRENIEQVVWRAVALFGTWLGSTDLKFAINRNGIAAYDLAIEAFSQCKRERSLAAGRGTNDRD
jgi:hypothetical protein